MYKRFFGLRENPFNVNPNPRYLFLTPQTEEALEELAYGIQARKGLFLLTGEVGTGKTTIINQLLDRLRQQRTPTAFVFNCRMEKRHLFDFILADFGVPCDSKSGGNVLIHLNRWLLERYGANDNPVLVLDEAQGLSLDVLEEIRLLQNLETPSEKLLQIVLVGQPELEQKLMRLELRQLRQRIAFHCKTAPLTLEETQGYIQTRLRVAGANGMPVFSHEAMKAVHLLSGGIPRVINLLCEESLMSAYVDEIRPVSASIVEDAAHQFELGQVRRPVPPADQGNPADVEKIPMQPLFGRAPIASPLAAEQFLMDPSIAGPILCSGCSPSSHGTSRQPDSTCMRDSQIIAFPAVSAHPAAVTGAEEEGGGGGEEEEEEAGRFPDSLGLTSEAAFQLLAAMAPRLSATASASLPSPFEVGGDVALAKASKQTPVQHSGKFPPRLPMNGSATQSLRRYGRKQILFLRDRLTSCSAWLRVRWSLIAASIRGAPMTAVLRISSREWARQLMNPIQAACRRGPEWWGRSSSMFQSIVRSQTLASANQWLRQPFARPQQQRPAHFRWVQVRTRLRLKKV
jgi:general secretion pathway protein A